MILLIAVIIFIGISLMLRTPESDWDAYTSEEPSITSSLGSYMWFGSFVIDDRMKMIFIHNPFESRKAILTYKLCDQNDEDCEFCGETFYAQNEEAFCVSKDVVGKKFITSDNNII